MIEWLTNAQLLVAVGAGVLACILSLVGRIPSDLTVGATALVELLLLGQLVVALASPAIGNEPTGNLAEFFVYLISAIIVPPAAVFWALIERTRWSTAILGASCLVVAIMVYRMSQIWFVQAA